MSTNNSEGQTPDPDQIPGPDNILRGPYSLEEGHKYFQDKVQRMLSGKRRPTFQPAEPIDKMREAHGHLQQAFAKANSHDAVAHRKAKTMDTLRQDFKKFEFEELTDDQLTALLYVSDTYVDEHGHIRSLHALKQLEAELKSIIERTGVYVLSPYEAHGLVEEGTV